jgi:hypothetical protein
MLHQSTCFKRIAVFTNCKHNGFFADCKHSLTPYEETFYIGNFHERLWSYYYFFTMSNDADIITVQYMLNEKILNN